MPVPLTPPYLQFFDSTGAPLSYGKVYTYAATTSTAKATYTDVGGLTLAPNPIQLNASGIPETGNGMIFIQGAYRIVVKDQFGAVVDDQPTVDSFTSTITSISPFFQSFSGNGSQTSFTLSQGFGTDSNELMIFIAEPKSGFFQQFSGTGAQTVFTLSTAKGTDSSSLLVYVYDAAAVDKKGFEPLASTAYTVNGTTLTFSSAPVTGTNNIYVMQPTQQSTSGIAGYIDPSLYTINNTALTFATAPVSGTNNIKVTAPSTLAGAAAVSAAAADASATAAENSAIAAAASELAAEGYANDAESAVSASLIINAAVFGVVADGSFNFGTNTWEGTDNTVAIQAALDSDYDAIVWPQGIILHTGTCYWWKTKFHLGTGTENWLRPYGDTTVGTQHPKTGTVFQTKGAGTGYQWTDKGTGDSTSWRVAHAFLCTGSIGRGITFRTGTLLGTNPAWESVVHICGTSRHDWECDIRGGATEGALYFDATWSRINATVLAFPQIAPYLSNITNIGDTGLNNNRFRGNFSGVKAVTVQGRVNAIVGTNYWAPNGISDTIIEGSLYNDGDDALRLAGGNLINFDYQAPAAPNGVGQNFTFRGRLDCAALEAVVLDQADKIRLDLTYAETSDSWYTAHSIRGKLTTTTDTYVVEVLGDGVNMNVTTPTYTDVRLRDRRYREMAGDMIFYQGYSDGTTTPMLYSDGNAGGHNPELLTPTGVMKLVNTTGGGIATLGDVVAQTIASDAAIASTVTWNGTPPSGASSLRYYWTKSNRICHFSLRLEYATAGTTNSSLTIAFPSDMPLPLDMTGWSASEIGVAIPCILSTATTSTNTSNARAWIGKDGSSNFLFSAEFGSANYKLAVLSGSYITAS